MSASRLVGSDPMPPAALTSSATRIITRTTEPPVTAPSPIARYSAGLAPPSASRPRVARLGCNCSIAVTIDR